MNFQMPRQDDDFDYYGNSSDDESRGWNFVSFVIYRFVIAFTFNNKSYWIKIFKTY